MCKRAGKSNKDTFGLIKKKKLDSWRSPLVVWLDQTRVSRPKLAQVLSYRPFPTGTFVTYILNYCARPTLQFFFLKKKVSTIPPPTKFSSVGLRGSYLTKKTERGTSPPPLGGFTWVYPLEKESTIPPPKLIGGFTWVYPLFLILESTTSFSFH
jgi:hypothetical protein